MAPFASFIALSSFVVATVTYAFVFALLIPSHPRTPLSRWLLSAVAGSALWALVLAIVLWYGGQTPARWIPPFDALHLILWVGFLAALLWYSGLVPGRSFSRLLGYGALASLAAIAISTLSFSESASRLQGQFIGTLAVALFGLFGLEQVFRNATLEERHFLKPLAICIGVKFAVDIFVYSQSLLFGAIELFGWSLRGFVNAAVAPLLVVAVKRQSKWGQDLFVSRHVIFYTTSMTAVGLYLLAMALGGYVIGESGAAWGPVLQLLFLILASGVLFYVLFSPSVRNRVKIFITKHFYRNRYDYRVEWLRLMQTLAGSEDASALSARSVKALAQIIASPRGELWLLNEQSSVFEAHAVWRATHTQSCFRADDALVRFMGQTHWIVDTREYRDNPEKYSNAFVSDDSLLLTPSIFVPLIHESSLVGIVRLDRPGGLGELGFEDHDLLKTAGQQVAIFLIQEQNQEALSETRQFEAFSRLTAFLMHDLKNMIAQQELVVGNAKRFRHRPDFIDDAIRTIEGSVQRMRALLERLQSADRHDKAGRVDLRKLLNEIVSACADREPAPLFSYSGGTVWVSIDRERLAMAITHAIRNAQDATDAEGRIDIRLLAHDGVGVIEIADTGIGMDADFIRDRLFRPFDSTKGAKGMGIGAYQIRETLRSVGGDTAVTSTVGRGTIVRMSLPLAPLPRATTDEYVA